jgi:hypothetical protein
MRMRFDEVFACAVKFPMKERRLRIGHGHYLTNNFLAANPSRDAGTLCHNGWSEPNAWRVSELMMGEPPTRAT